MTVTYELFLCPKCGDVFIIKGGVIRHIDGPSTCVLEGEARMHA